MTAIRVLVARLLGTAGWRRRERELDDEVQAHLDLLASEHRQRGLSADDARRAARRDFGGMDQVKERVRDERGFMWLDALRRDVAYAVRTLLRTPAFTLAAVSTLALGIGATTAIFSVAHAALLRPLPYPDWRDLRTVRTTFTDGRVTSGLVGPLEMTRLKDPTLPIVRAAMSVHTDLTLVRDNHEPLALAASGVDDQFFPLFGLPLQLGAGFTPPYFVPRGPVGAVLSHRLWTTVFNQDPAIVGKTLRLAGGDLPIVGVASPDMDVPRGTDVWVNLQLDPQSTNHSFDGYLRVRPGTTTEALASGVAAAAARLGHEFPGPEGNRAFIIQPLVDTMVGDLRPILIIVWSATALLLVLACVNVTNLLLARASRRAREIAIRAAVGAGRLRIVMQLLIESLVLAGAGTVVGVGVAYVGVRVLLLYGASKLPRLESVPFDTPVLLFAMAMLVVSAVGVGLAPAMQLAGVDMERHLRAVGRSVRGARSTHRALRTMIVAEVAVAVTIVAGAGLLVRSFLNLQEQNPGFESRGRLTFDVVLPPKRGRDAGVPRAWMQTLFTSLQHQRGVTAVGGSSDFPMRSDIISSRPLIQVDGWSASHVHVVAMERVVTPDFFKAMGMRVRRGRGFTDDDRETTAPVAIVNDAFVRAYLGDRDPLTAQMSFGFPQVNPATKRAIVGVVNDVKYASLWSSADPAFYLVQDQAWNVGGSRLTVVVSTGAADPGALIPAIRGAVRTMNPDLAFTVEPVTTLVASTLTRQKLGTMLMLLFGAMAVLLATIGIYGMIAYASAARHGEIATRMALGATRGRIFWLLSREGLVVAIAGAAIGLGVAYGAGRLVTSWLYEVQASDPWILVSALVVVVGVTTVATLLPIRKACRIDPSLSLRFE